MKVGTSLLLAALSVAARSVAGAGISSTTAFPTTVTIGGRAGGGGATTPGGGGTTPERAARSLFDLDATLRQWVDSPVPEQELKAVREQMARTKRNGDDFLTSALTSKSGFLESLKTAYGDIQAPSTYPEPEKKSFNLLGFKKAIFGTLLQAVKAITGGVIALKGQLIKVTGHIAATKGKVLATKGDVISELGRHIASKALAQPFYHYEGTPPLDQSKSAVFSYFVKLLGLGGGHTGYSAPSAPSYGYHGYGSYHSSYPTAPVYGPPHHSSHSSYPSGPSSYYTDYHRLSRQSKPGYPAPNVPGAPAPAGAPQPHAGQLPPGVQAGLLVLKPVQVPLGHNGHTQGPPLLPNKAATLPPSTYSSVQPSGFSHPPPPVNVNVNPQQSPYSVAPQLFHNPVQPRYPPSSGAYQVNPSPESFENYDQQESRFQYPSQPNQNGYHEATKRSPIKRLFEVPTGPGYDFAS
nr:PREDICTED: uncharacterized protein LOC109038890 isoform X1 [Bemisia tabaci]